MFVIQLLQIQFISVQQFLLRIDLSIKYRLYRLCLRNQSVINNSNYKTEYIRRIGIPVTNVAHEMFAHVISILSLYKHLYIYKVYLHVVMTKFIWLWPHS